PDQTFKMASNSLFLGVDGGGTRCRARLCDSAGQRLGEGESGPANIRRGVQDAYTSVLAATRQALEQARLTAQDLPRITACLALAGATEPVDRHVAETHHHAFHSAIITSDAHAACIGAHHGGDGGVVIVGTGSIGWGVLGGTQYRVGGWGFELSDEGSGAWIGREALRRVLLAHDGRAAESALTGAILAQFAS